MLFLPHLPHLPTHKMFPRTCMQAPISFQTVAGGEEWPAMDFEDINTKIQFYGKNW